jgi:radical SAM superfamily enzyme YgiQ (UPF0313 family)
MHHALIFNVHNVGLKRASGAHRIASFLRENEWDVEVVDYTDAWDIEELKEFSKSRISSKTVFIGFSIFFYYWPDKMVEFAQWIKKEFPWVKTVIGGQSKQIINTAGIDYYVHGYGEYAILELVKSMLGNSNANIRFDSLYFGTKKVITANHAYPAFPMKSLRIKYEDRDDIQPWEWLTMEFARGCIFNCPYCNFPVLGVREDHTRTAEDFEAEFIENYERWGVKHYYIADETFNDYSEKITKYADIVAKTNIKPYFSGFLRADLLVARPQDWDPLIALGAFGHFYGIETMNYESSKVIGKGMATERLQSGLSEIRRYFKSKGPYRGSMGIVVGLPHETIESQMNTFKWLDKNWAGESTHVWPLEIPINPKDDVLSKMSKDYKKYGYRESNIMPEEIPAELFEFGHSESRIKHINNTLIWENDNMSFRDACKIADQWNLEAFQKKRDIGISMFTIGDYIYPDLDINHILATKKISDWPDNRTSPREREYINKKLGK